MRATGGSDGRTCALTMRARADPVCTGCDTDRRRGRTGLSVLSEGLRFRQWRLQLPQLSAMPGDGIRPRCLVRRQFLIPPRPRAERGPLQPKETLMRALALTIVAAVTLVAAAPSRAQTYDPDYPVCLHVYGPVSYYECHYTSLPQCNMSASGRGHSAWSIPISRAPGSRVRRRSFAIIGITVTSTSRDASTGVNKKPRHHGGAFACAHRHQNFIISGPPNL